MSSFETEYLENEDIIYITTRGEITIPYIKDEVKSLAEFSEKFNCLRCINEVKEINVKLSIFDIYRIPQFLMDFNINRHIKIAILNSQTKYEMYFKFVVVINRNFGFNMEMFFNKQDAIDWLNE